MNKFTNIIASLVGRGGSILLTLAFTPFYIRTLSFEAYGLVGFFAVIQSIATLLELGLPLALNRAVARFSNDFKNPNEISQLIKSFEKFFASAAIFISLLSIPASILLADHWFNFETLDKITVIYSLVLIFILAALRFPIGIYLAVLAGLHMQVRMNLFVVTFAAIRLGGAALVIWLWEPTLILFFSTQIFISLIELITLRRVAWNARPEFNHSVKISWHNFKSQIRFAVAIGGITILGVVLLQIDKIILSKVLSLSDFGQYSVIAIIGSGLITIGYPIGNVSFPHFSMIAAKNNKAVLLEEFQIYLNMVKGLILPLSMTLAFYSQEVLSFYLTNTILSEDMFLSFCLFMIAAGFGAMRPVPYGLIIAMDKHKYVLKYYIGLIIGYPPILVYLISAYNIVGAAAGFLILQLLSVMVFIGIAVFALDKKNIITILYKDLILPVCFVSLFTYAAGWLITPILLGVHFSYSFICLFLCSFVFWFILFIPNKQKLLIFNIIKKKRVR